MNRIIDQGDVGVGSTVATTTDDEVEYSVENSVDAAVPQSVTDENEAGEDSQSATDENEAYED